MSLQLLTLRPPPNVDFIAGYPGLAPGPPDRPHAAVIGTLELRTPQPIKAKWVHVELRKIESVPGAPPFVDTIGAKPTTVWEPTGSDFGTLTSQDFMFSIRIPESIPPTVTLDNGRAGIRYELIATLCGKGKKGLLRRDTSPLTVVSTEIAIFKHELHPTWPVYQQPEERNVSKEGMTLSVTRKKTCLGADQDYVQMNAMLYADVPVNLRSFELALMQKLTYPNSSTTQTMKNGVLVSPPPARASIISEQKRPCPARIQAGMHQACELTCMLPPNYSAMTVATARLIENTYEVHVSAVMEDGTSISLGMPITISPFPIDYSIRTMPNMGMPPRALDDPARASLHPPSRPASAASHQVGPSRQDPRLSPHQQRPYHIAERVGGQLARDDSLLGGPPSPNPAPINNTLPTSGSQTNGWGAQHQTGTYQPDNRGGPTNEFGQANGGGLPPPSQPLQTQPTSPVQQPAPIATISSRFAVVNGTTEPESPRSSALHEPYLSAAEEKRRIAEQMRNADAYAAVPPPGGPPVTENVTSPAATLQNLPTTGTSDSSSTAPPKGKNWVSAEEEKKRLFEQARTAAEKTQRKVANTSITSSPSAKVASPKPKQLSEVQMALGASTNGAGSSTSSSSSPAVSPSPKSSSGSKPGDKKWMPAEEEKRKLYEKAQARALKTQAKAASAAGSSAGVGRSNSTASATGSINTINPYSSTSGLRGADLYKSAMSNVKNNQAATNSPPTSLKQTPPAAANLSLTPPPVTPPAAVQSQLRTFTPPPPPQPPANSWLSAEDEKAKLRYLEAKRAVDRHVASQDDEYGSDQGGPSGSSYNAMAGGSSQYTPNPINTQPWASPPPNNPMLAPSISPSITGPTPPPPAADPPAFDPSYGYSQANEVSEKEKMRLAYQQQDNGPPDYAMPPPGSPSDNTNYGTVTASGMTQDSIMSATEEKARLRAQFAAQDALSGSSGGGGSGFASGSGSLSRNYSYSASPAPTPAPPVQVSSPRPPEPAMSADGTRTLTAVEERALQMMEKAASRPISSVAPAPPPPRMKSPAPSAGLSEYGRQPAISLMSASSTTPIDDYLRRDPSITQGKQRALSPGLSPPGSAGIPQPFVAPPPPPPLAPRPPVEYIQKTREEDMKIRRMTQEAVDRTVYGDQMKNGKDSTSWLNQGYLNGPSSPSPLGLPPLEMRPFSPIDLSVDTNGAMSNGRSGTTPSTGYSFNSYR